MDFIKDFFLEANPNPERVGCPDEPTIKALAEDRLAGEPSGTPAHGEGFECFAEYRGFRLKWLDARKLRRKILAGAIVASLAIFAAGGGVWEFQHLRAGAADMASTVPVDPMSICSTLVRSRGTLTESTCCNRSSYQQL